MKVYISTHYNLLFGEYISNEYEYNMEVLLQMKVIENFFFKFLLIDLQLFITK